MNPSPRISLAPPSRRELPEPEVPVPFEPMPGPSDQSGAFTALYQKTLAPLRRYLSRLLGNTAEAQDVAHDAYMRVYRTMDKREARQPEALLYVTARRLAINQIKRRNVSPISPDSSPLEWTASQGPGVERQVMARQEWSLLEKAISELPPGCRSVLLLRKVELLSHKEIGDRLGIAISTVEKQHARALRLLKAALDAETGRELGGSGENSEKEAES